MHFDREQYLAWQKKLEQNSFFSQTVKSFGVYSVLIFAAIAVFVLMSKPPVFLAAAIAFVVARFVVVPAIDYFYKKPRPYQRFGFAPAALMLTPDQHPDAFPSQHVISLAAISVALWHFSIAVAIVGLILSIIAGIARVILGYHYPIDVLGGFLLGSAIGAITLIFTH